MTVSEVEFKKFAVCDTCGVETLCREVGIDDQCGGCYLAPINAAKHQSELAALREELAQTKDVLATANRTLGEFADDSQIYQQRLTAAEQRNAELVGLLTEHQWEWEPYDSHNHRDGGYYCVECSESQKVGHSDKCKISAALKPTESGVSE